MEKEGGIESFLERLPKYKFQRIGASCEKQNGDSQIEEIQEPPSGKMTECNTDTPTEHVLPLEDAVSFRYLSTAVTFIRIPPPCFSNQDSSSVIHYLCE